MLNMEDKQWSDAIENLKYERLRRRRLAWSASVYLRLIDPSNATALLNVKIISTIVSVPKQPKLGKQVKTMPPSRIEATEEEIQAFMTRQLAFAKKFD